MEFKVCKDIRFLSLLFTTGTELPVKVRTHQARTIRSSYAPNAAKMLLDHFVSKMVLRTQLRACGCAGFRSPRKETQTRRVWVHDRAWIGLD